MGRTFVIWPHSFTDSGKDSGKNEWMNEWMNTWMSEIMNEWMNEWMNTWMSEMMELHYRHFYAFTVFYALPNTPSPTLNFSSFFLLISFCFPSPFFYLSYFPSILHFLPIFCLPPHHFFFHIFPESEHLWIRSFMSQVQTPLKLATFIFWALIQMWNLFFRGIVFKNNRNDHLKRNT